MEFYSTKFSDTEFSATEFLADLYGTAERLTPQSRKGILNSATNCSSHQGNPYKVTPLAPHTISVHTKQQGNLLRTTNKIIRNSGARQMARPAL